MKRRRKDLFGAEQLGDGAAEHALLGVDQPLALADLEKAKPVSLEVV